MKIPLIVWDCQVPIINPGATIYWLPLPAIVSMRANWKRPHCRWRVFRTTGWVKFIWEQNFRIRQVTRIWPGLWHLLWPWIILINNVMLSTIVWVSMLLRNLERTIVMLLSGRPDYAGMPRKRNLSKIGGYSMNWYCGGHTGLPVLKVLLPISLYRCILIPIWWKPIKVRMSLERRFMGWEIPLWSGRRLKIIMFHWILRCFVIFWVPKSSIMKNTLKIPWWIIVWRLLSVFWPWRKIWVRFPIKGMKLLYVWCLIVILLKKLIGILFSPVRTINRGSNKFPMPWRSWMKNKWPLPMKLKILTKRISPISGKRVLCPVMKTVIHKRRFGPFARWGSILRQAGKCF